MHNILVDQRRRAARRGRLVALDQVGGGLAEAPNQAISADLLDFKRVFYKLSQDQQQVLLLVGLEGLAYEGVATITGVGATRGCERC